MLSILQLDCITYHEGLFCACVTAHMYIHNMNVVVLILCLGEEADVVSGLADMDSSSLESALQAREQISNLMERSDDVILYINSKCRVKYRPGLQY